MVRKWKPSKAAKVKFMEEMKRIEEFCNENNIVNSLSNDSYYFEINGQKYRVSNHSVESSDSGALNWLGEQTREKYHGGRDDNTIYIHASKTRIIEIYNNLKAGNKLDGRGNIKI